MKIVQISDIHVGAQFKEETFDLAVEEIKVVEALKAASEKMSAEKLLTETSLGIGQLNKSLATLTIKGIIKEINGKYFI